MSLRKLLRARMAAGRIIHADARVDPGGFPEEEFPVRCGKCGYLLCGLPSQRCPECGQEIDRGRLLVEQYVLAQVGEPGWGRMNRLAVWCLVGGFLLVGLLAYVAPQVLDAYNAARLRIPAVDGLGVWLRPLIGLAVVLLIVGGCVWLWLRLRTERKARRVLAGLGGPGGGGDREQAGG